MAVPTFEPNEQRVYTQAEQEAANLNGFWGEPGLLYYYVRIPVKSGDLGKFLLEFTIKSIEKNPFVFIENNMDNPAKVQKGKDLDQNSFEFNEDRSVILCLQINREADAERGIQQTLPQEKQYSVSKPTVVGRVNVETLFSSSIRAVIVPDQLRDEVGDIVQSAAFENSALIRMQPDYTLASATLPSNQIILQEALEHAKDIVVSKEGWLTYIGRTTPVDYTTAMEVAMDKSRRNRISTVTGILQQLELAVAEVATGFYTELKLPMQADELVTIEADRVRREFFVDKPQKESIVPDPKNYDTLLLEEIGSTGVAAMLIHEFAVILHGSDMFKSTTIDEQNFFEDFGLRLRQIGTKYTVIQNALKAGMTLRGNAVRKAEVGEAILKELYLEKKYVLEKSRELKQLIAEQTTESQQAKWAKIAGIYDRLMSAIEESSYTNDLTSAEKIGRVLYIVNLKRQGVNIPEEFQILQQIPEQTLMNVSNDTLNFIYKIMKRLEALDSIERKRTIAHKS